jgi:hypothetical protein
MELSLSANGSWLLALPAHAAAPQVHVSGNHRLCPIRTLPRPPRPPPTAPAQLWTCDSGGNQQWKLG